MNLLLKLKMATLAKAVARDAPAILFSLARAIAETKRDEEEEGAAEVLFAIAKWGERNPERLEDALREALGVDR